MVVGGTAVADGTGIGIEVAASARVGVGATVGSSTGVGMSVSSGCGIGTRGVGTEERVGIVTGMEVIVGPRVGVRIGERVGVAAVPQATPKIATMPRKNANTGSFTNLVPPIAAPRHKGLELYSTTDMQHGLALKGATRAKAANPR